MKGYSVFDNPCHKDEKHLQLQMIFSFLPLLILIHGIKRAFKFCDPLLYQMKINDSGFYGGMPKKLFEGKKICSL
jgi:hypothetical protein